MTGLVVLIAVLVVGLGGAATTFGLWLRRKSAAGRAELAAELVSDPAVRGPESGIYRGTTGAYSKVMGNGTIVLTGHRLMFRKATGGRVDVALADVTQVETQKVFNKGVVGNRVHLVVRTGKGDLGYFVGDPDAWAAAVKHAARLT